jgi:hypothetical protein
MEMAMVVFDLMVLSPAAPAASAAASGTAAAGLSAAAGRAHALGTPAGAGSSGASIHPAAGAERARVSSTRAPGNLPVANAVTATGTAIHGPVGVAAPYLVITRTLIPVWAIRAIRAVHGVRTIGGILARV